MPILSGSDDRDEEAYITDDWEASSTGKENSSEFRGSTAITSSRSSYTSLSLLTRSHSFLINTVTLPVDTL